MRRLFSVLLAFGVGPIPALAAPPYRIVMIPAAVGTPFWRSVAVGATQAGRELGAEGISVSIDWRAPVGQNNVAGQLKLVREAVAQGADGIILAPLDRQALIPAAEAAAARRIPLVTIESGLDSRYPCAWVGTDNYSAGQAAAVRLAALLGGHGNVILLRHHINVEATEEREEGFLSIIQQRYPAIDLLVTDFHAGPTTGIADRVVPALIGRYRDRLNGIFASSECAGSVVLATLRRLGLADGKVKFVAVEDEGTTLRAALAGGDIQALIAQDPRAMGDRSVRLIAARLRGRPVPPVVYTDFRVLTPTDPAGVPAALRSDAPPAAIEAGGATVVVPGLDLAMVAIPPGEFTLGAPTGQRGFRDVDNRPTRVRFAHGFWLGKFEVTQAQWREVMGTNPSNFRGDLLPVDNVSWDDAMAFCRKLTRREREGGRLPAGYRYTLPTEAQWEYACRAGTTGVRAGDLAEMGWYVGNSGTWAHPPGPASPRDEAVWRMGTHPVGQKRPNAWGLYDMYGNVLEWCRDFYGPFPGGLEVDPTGPRRGRFRVLRGGGWWTDAGACTSFTRAHAPPSRHHSALGFRLALVACPTSAVELSP